MKEVKDIGILGLGERLESLWILGSYKEVFSVNVKVELLGEVFQYHLYSQFREKTPGYQNIWFLGGDG